MSKIETPIYTHLKQYIYEKRIPFAMPGHKNGRGFNVDFGVCDVTELQKTLNLYGNDDVITRANRLLSDFYNTRESMILTCGSTGAIQTMIASVLKAGETLLVTSDCHMSVINTCALLGVKIRMVSYENNFEISPDISAVLITSPNYYGVTKDIRKISEKCRKAGVLFLVDEAHGTHFTGKYGLPQSSVCMGADMVCQSAHKTLNAMTSASYLHICSDRVDAGRVKKACRAFNTSSPSYVIAASADYARAMLEKTDYTGIISLCNKFKEYIQSETEISFLKNDDPTRLVMSLEAYNISGYEAERKLSESYGIDIEMADIQNMVLIATPYNTENDFECLKKAIIDILRNAGKGQGESLSDKAPVTDGLIEPSYAWNAKTKTVLLRESEGEVSAETICVYPPGTAVVVMGGKISKDAIDFLRRCMECGAEIVGINDGRIEVVSNED